MLHKANDKKGYELVGFVSSKSNPNKQYAIKRSLLTGQLSCECPAWRFKKGPLVERTCKHLKSLRGDANAPKIVKDDTAIAFGAAKNMVRRYIELED